MREMLPIFEIVAGIIALVISAMAFTNLAWAQGASSPELQRESSAKTRRLFYWAGVFWVITVVCLYLSFVWHAPIIQDTMQG